jgi:hypothetical protein
VNKGNAVVKQTSNTVLCAGVQPTQKPKRKLNAIQTDTTHNTVSKPSAKARLAGRGKANS